MGVTVITGRSGSGKSRRLMDHIKSLISDPFKKIIVIVPGQLTFATEKNIMESCGVKGILGLQVFSIQRLAMKILEESCIPDFLSNAEKAVLCGRALRSLGNPLFQELPDIEVCAAQLISRLKAYGQTPQSLRCKAEEITDAALSEKLETIAQLYEKYTELCAKPDASDMYAMAAAAAGNADFLKGTHIVIDGLDNCSPAVMSMLTEVMRRAEDTVAAFRSEGDGGDPSLFISERRDMLRFINAARCAGQEVTEESTNLAPRYESPELSFLETNLYKYPYVPYENEVHDIRLFAAESLEQEVEMLASNILSEVKNGRRFREIAVVGGGMDSYLPAIKSQFSLCGIPFFYDERRSLAENPLFEFLYSALNAAAGDTSAIEKYVFGLFSPLTPDEQITLKKFSKKYSLRGWRFLYPFSRDESAEAMRQKAAWPLERLSLGLKQQNAQSLIDAIIRFLSECGARDKHEQFCTSLDYEDARAEHSYFVQVYDKSIEVLDGIGRILRGHADPKELCSIVKTAFSATKIAVIPPTTDEVALFDISTVRLPGVDVLFAIGLHDGVWPAKDDGPGILSGAEREALYSSGLDVGVYDPSEEKLKTYTALVKPKYALYLSHNSSTGQPSILIDRIRRLFPRLAPRTRAQFASINGVQARVLSELSGALSGTVPSDETKSICSLLMKQPLWREKAEAILLRTNDAESVAPGTAAALYGALRCSATRIEDYYRCPFRHFLDFGLRAQAEREYVGDRLDTGTFMHLALDIFTKKLLEDRKDIRTLSEAEVETRMRDAAAQAAQSHDGAKLLEDERFSLQYAAIARDLVGAAKRIRTHFAGSCASIYSSEQEFRGFTVATRFGNVAISGKIDRIDEADGYFRVVDYKSSSKGFKPKEFAGGVSIQLPVYIAAAQRLLKDAGRDLQPAGGYYMRIGDEYAKSAEEVDKNARLSGISLKDAQVISAFSAVMYDGSFSAVDQKLTRSGELNGAGKSRLFSREEMDALLERLNSVITDAAEGIYGGNTAINPAATGAGGTCAYCDYGSVCLRDFAYEGNTEREITDGEDEEAADGME